MSDPRAVEGAERSLKRQRELEELAAAGDEWAKERLQINVKTRRYRQKKRDSAANGNVEAKRQLSEENANRTTRHGQRRARLAASHAQVTATRKTHAERLESEDEEPRPRRRDHSSAETSPARNNSTRSRYLTGSAPRKMQTTLTPDDNNDDGGEIEVSQRKSPAMGRASEDSSDRSQTSFKEDTTGAASIKPEFEDLEPSPAIEATGRNDGEESDSQGGTVGEIV